MIFSIIVPSLFLFLEIQMAAAVVLSALAREGRTGQFGWSGERTVLKQQRFSPGSRRRS